MTLDEIQKVGRLSFADKYSNSPRGARAGLDQIARLDDHRVQCHYGQEPDEWVGLGCTECEAEAIPLLTAMQ